MCMRLVIYVGNILCSSTHDLSARIHSQVTQTHQLLQLTINIFILYHGAPFSPFTILSRNIKHDVLRSTCAAPPWAGECGCTRGRAGCTLGLGEEWAGPCPWPCNRWHRQSSSARATVPGGRSSWRCRWRRGHRVRSLRRRFRWRSGSCSSKCHRG